MPKLANWRGFTPFYSLLEGLCRRRIFTSSAMEETARHVFGPCSPRGPFAQHEVPFDSVCVFAGVMVIVQFGGRPFLGTAKVVVFLFVSL